MIHATVGVLESTKFIYLNSSYCRSKLLQYSGPRVELKDGFFFVKNDLQRFKMVNFTLDLGFCKNSGGECLETKIKQNKIRKRTL